MSVDTLIPLTVAVPLITGAVLAAGDDKIPRRLPDAVATAAAAFVSVACCWLLVATANHRIVYWFGGWEPVRGLAVGIDFSVEPLAAALAALAAVICTGVFVFAWRYFEEVGHMFHTLVLAFLAGMVGFALSGDLFNIFVWLELMSVAAYALCGYQVRRTEVIQGAFNFATINSIGAFSMLLGIALVYGRTGALNLSQIGHDLAQHRPDGLVVVSFALITAGFLVKAGAVPFHFWLSDAYAVAPGPVGALFAGVMTDLAFHAYAKVYWDGYAEVFTPDRGAIRAALLALAVASAVVGAVMCALQADLKRQLAFLSVNTGGVLLAGIALMTDSGLASSTLGTVTGGLLRAALFMVVTVVIQTHGVDDELSLRGRGRHRYSVLPAVVLTLSALGLASLPPVGTFLSVALLYDGSGLAWLNALLAVTTAVGAATVLRTGARVFLGWGAADDPMLTRQESDGAEPKDSPDLSVRRRRLLLVPALLLVGVSYVASTLPGVAQHLLAAAHSFQDYAATQAQVLHGIAPATVSQRPYAPSTSAWLYGALSTVLALGFAALGLWWQRVLGWLKYPLLPPARVLKSVHSGILGDYVLWLMTGVGLLGAAWLVTAH